MLSLLLQKKEEVWKNVFRECVPAQMHTRSFCSLDKQMHINLWSTKNQQTPCIPFVILIGNLFNSQERLDDFRYNRFWCSSRTLQEAARLSFRWTINIFLFPLLLCSSLLCSCLIKRDKIMLKRYFYLFLRLSFSVFTEFPETLSRTCSLLCNQIVFRL